MILFSDSDAHRRLQGASRKHISQNTLLRDTLAEKATAMQTVVKIGRTHWMDATPLTFGQEFGYVTELITAKALENTLPHLRELALG